MNASAWANAITATITTRMAVYRRMGNGGFTVYAEGGGLAFRVPDPLIPLCKFCAPFELSLQAEKAD
jgi:hypothetical protein